MKRLALTPIFMALGCVLAGNAHAQSHDHSHHHPQQKPPSPQSSPPQAEEREMLDDHSAHSGHNHSSHAHHHAASGPTFPPITAADRAAAFPDLGDMTMADHGMDDDAVYFRTLFDGLEWRRARDGGSDAIGWNATTWIGRDIDKLWLKTSGERRAGRTGNARIEALWGHAIGPWWDTVVGIRHDSRPGPSQTRAALGVQGLAPYQFEVDAMLYLGGPGKAELHLEAEYDLLFTWRWILTPSLATGLIAESDARHGVASGWSGLEAGLKLRYEIRPDLAPYIGYAWHGGGNAHAEEKGGHWVAGLRFWF